MKLITIIPEDFVNYKSASLVLEFPYCSFKCDKECGEQVCQNSPLANSSTVDIDVHDLIDRYYIDDPITEAVVMQGLEPFDSWGDVKTFVDVFRTDYRCDDDIVIYTGYYESEIQDKIGWLRQYDNIIVKFGRYLPGQKLHHDDVLGIDLASDNQYAVIL